MDAIGQYNLASNLAESVTHVPDNPIINRFETWSWVGNAAIGWSYADIPYSIMKNMAKDALATAGDVNTTDNYLYWEIWDAPKEVLLYTFKLFTSANQPGEG